MKTKKTVRIIVKDDSKGSACILTKGQSISLEGKTEEETWKIIKNHYINLKLVTLPNVITSIDSEAFANCQSLTQITIPDSVTKIGNSAFRNCSSLTQITILGSVTSIGEAAFSGCSNLKRIIVSSAEQEEALAKSFGGHIPENITVERANNE